GWGGGGRGGAFAARGGCRALRGSVQGWIQAPSASAGTSRHKPQAPARGPAAPALALGACVCSTRPQRALDVKLAEKKTRPPQKGRPCCSSPGSRSCQGSFFALRRRASAFSASSRLM